MLEALGTAKQWQRLPLSCTESSYEVGPKSAAESRQSVTVSECRGFRVRLFVALIKFQGTGLGAPLTHQAPPQTHKALLQKLNK